MIAGGRRSGPATSAAYGGADGTREAIRALEQVRGDILETGAAGEGNTSSAA